MLGVQFRGKDDLHSHTGVFLITSIKVARCLFLGSGSSLHCPLGSGIGLELGTRLRIGFDESGLELPFLRRLKSSHCI